ncbi:hypothetical protein GTY54_50175 [Streptomyces sp. SID625]|nr:hypothetical protein [Streptomyces sp. SID625]
MEPVERARTARDSFAPCYGARYQMSITAASPVVTASEEAFRRLRDVRDLAAAGTLAGDEAYSGGRAGDEAYSGGRAGDEAALARLREAMRLDLGAHRVPSRAPDPLGHRPDGRGIAFSPPLHALAPLLALHRPTAREEAELGRIWSVRNLCAGAPVRPDPRAPV